MPASNTANLSVPDQSFAIMSVPGGLQMSLKARWYDTLLVGGLFWLPQPLLLVLLLPGLFDRLSGFQTFFTNLSDPLETLLSTTILAFATLLFLVTGTILEMSGAGLPAWEIGPFYRHIVNNQAWVEQALQKYSSYARDDLDKLENILAPDGEFKHEYRTGTLLLLALRDHKKYNQIVPVLSAKWKDAIAAFNRLYLLILVKAVSKNSKEPSDLLIGPIEAWRLSRLLVNAFGFLTFEIIIFSLIVFFKGLFAGFSTEDPSASPLRILATPLMIYGLGIGISLAILYFTTVFTKRGFDRVCLVLFSLWYDSETSEENKLEANEREGNRVASKSAVKTLKQVRAKAKKNGGRRA
jgi:hypothetical protein